VRDIDAATALAIVWAFEDHIESLGVEEVYLTSAPVLYQPVLSQNLEFALLYSGYAYQRHYISHITQLPESGNPAEAFDPIAKRYIRRAKSHYPGVTIEEVTPERFEAALEEFYPIIVSNKARREATPTHSLEDLKKLNLLLPELIKLWLLRLDGELIAGSLIFLPNARVPLSFYPMMRYEFSDVRPIYLLSEVMMQWAQANGYRYFDLGVSQDTNDENPMTPALSLIEFKEKFNSRGILRSTLAKSYKK
jgi:lipid II:glycine glycyltransferase (peptidoglycan interpeptide bridge formation enzyme)